MVAWGWSRFGRCDIPEPNQDFVAIAAGWYHTQRLLEHSTPQPTNDVYTNVDPALRQAISQLPVAEWV